MRIQVSDVVSFGSFVLAAFSYMKVKRKIVFWLFIVISLVALSVSIFSRSESSSPQKNQSATASGGSTINQAGRDINIGISESTMLTLLREKVNARDRELAEKYPLGCVLLGVLSDGKVIYQPGPHSLKFDPANDIKVTIDTATKIAHVSINFFQFRSETGLGATLDDMGLDLEYVENSSQVLPLGFADSSTGRVFRPYIEVLDESNKIFVIGFK